MIRNGRFLLSTRLEAVRSTDVGRCRRLGRLTMTEGRQEILCKESQSDGLSPCLGSGRGRRMCPSQSPSAGCMAARDTSPEASRRARATRRSYPAATDGEKYSRWISRSYPPRTSSRKTARATRLRRGRPGRWTFGTRVASPRISSLTKTRSSIGRVVRELVCLAGCPVVRDDERPRTEIPAVASPRRDGAPAMCARPVHDVVPVVAEHPGSVPNDSRVTRYAVLSSCSSRYDAAGVPAVSPAFCGFVPGRSGVMTPPSWCPCALPFRGGGRLARRLTGRSPTRG